MAPEPDDDDLDPDDPDDDEGEDDEDEDDEDEGDDGDEGEEPEDAARQDRATPQPSSEPSVAATSPVAAVPVFGNPAAREERDVDRAAKAAVAADVTARLAAAKAARATAATEPIPGRDTAGRFLGRRAKRPFFDLTDSRLTSLDIRKYEWNASLRKNAERYVRAAYPPFVAQTWPRFLSWVRDQYGPGIYRVVQRGVDGYISSRTFDLTEGIPVQEVTDDLIPNGQSHAPVGNGSAPAVGAPSAPGHPYAGMDYKTALVVVGIPALTSAVTAFAAAMAKRPPDTSFDRILEVVKLAQVTNAERAELFKQAMDLAQTIERAQPAAAENPAALGDLSALANSVAQIIQALKPNTPPPAAAASPALTAGSPQMDPAQFLEQMIVHEIQRAVAQGDEPECLVLILESWLDSVSLAWLCSSDDETVLRELPLRYPTHGDYLKQEPVQNFLRRALAMLREDDASAEEGPARENAVIEGNRALASAAAPA